MDFLKLSLNSSPKTDPMLVSVDPVEHRRKMYYVVKKKIFWAVWRGG